MGLYRLTVLMAVYNGIPYLSAAIDSILAQTYSDFKFLIVDDASTDDTREVVNSYKDQRIQLHCLDSNVGQTAALDIGLRCADTEWIARMDADDYSDPFRIEDQMAALDQDKELSCVGTYAWTFKDNPLDIDGVITTPLTSDNIKKALLRGSPLIHGSLVINRQALLKVGGYNGIYRYSADLDMYDRFLHYYKAICLPKSLIGVRRHLNQGSRTIEAFNENIEIFTIRLSEGEYSKQDETILKASLAFHYLIRSQRYITLNKFGPALKDLFFSISTSPRSFVINLIRVVASSFPERNKSFLKRIVKLFKRF